MKRCCADTGLRVYPATQLDGRDFERGRVADVHGTPVNLSPAQVKRLRVWMRDRAVPGSAESLIGGLILGGETEITDETITEVIALMEQYMALHGERWFDVLVGRGDASDDDPSAAIEPRLN